MERRQAFDLSEYSVSELLQLIYLAKKLLKQKLGGELPARHSVLSVSESGVSEAAADASAFDQPRQRPQVQAPLQSGSSCAAPRVFERPDPPVSQLRNPWIFDFHCKYCDVQCCRPEPHKNHACLNAGDRVMTGHILHVIYSRSRWSYVCHVTSLYIDHDQRFLELSTRDHKTNSFRRAEIKVVTIGSAMQRCHP